MTLTTQQKTALLAARDTAQKALTDLSAAIDLLDFAPVGLQGFAIGTISKATSTIVSGAPDPAAVLKTIQAGIVPGVTPSVATAKPAPGPATAGAEAETAAQASADTVASDLNTYSTNAESIVQGINEGWSSFTACTTTTS